MYLPMGDICNGEGNMLPCMLHVTRYLSYFLGDAH